MLGPFATDDQMSFIPTDALLTVSTTQHVEVKTRLQVLISLASAHDRQFLDFIVLCTNTASNEYELFRRDPASCVE